MLLYHFQVDPEPVRHQARDPFDPEVRRGERCKSTAQRRAVVLPLMLQKNILNVGTFTFICTCKNRHNPLHCSLLAEFVFNARLAPISSFAAWTPQGYLLSKTKTYIIIAGSVFPQPQLRYRPVRRKLATSKCEIKMQM